MAGQKRRKSISVLGGAATLNPPSPSRTTWTVNYRDNDGKPRSTSGGRTREEAEMKARAKLGWSIPNDRGARAQAPTFTETYEKWVQKNSERWNPRTIDNYTYVGKIFLNALGERPLSSLTPSDFAAVNTNHLSRGQQKKVRSLVRGVLKDNSQWTLHEPEKLAQAITVSGTAAASRREAIERGDIPSPDYVNSLILCAYSTLQESPIGDSTNSPDWKTDPHHYTEGLPTYLTDEHRRGIPEHYGNIEERKAAETKELASIYRRMGLLIALGAGGGLRIGEVLALRPRHFFTMSELPIATLGFEAGNDGAMFMNYLGKLRIEEQCSQSSKGKVWITRPKGRQGGKPRTLNLPALMPAGYSNNFAHGHTTIRQQVAHIVPRFEDTATSLWSMTEEEALTLWKNGYPPLALMLFDRFAELWNSDTVQKHQNERVRYETFSNLLLFPTRNPARTGRDGLPNVMYEKGWEKRVKIVEGTGTYYTGSNLARKFTNPIYDYVSENMNSYPVNRAAAQGRNGWTHHSLRHYAITSWLESAAQIPLNVIAEQAGHQDISFTLKRYAHIIGSRKTPTTGFEI